MTECLKTERQAEYVQRLLTEVLDPHDWENRTAVMAAFLDRLGTQLPPEIRSQSPDRYARHVEEIVHTYVQSLDRAHQLLRRL